eukprot:366298-Chlamydomonas_euryale.AAC.10
MSRCGVSGMGVRLVQPELNVLNALQFLKLNQELSRLRRDLLAVRASMNPSRHCKLQCRTKATSECGPLHTV